MSNNFPATMHIAIAEAKDAAQAEPGDLTAKLKAAMKATKGHWLVTSEDQQFRSAVGGVMLVYGPGSEEFKRLERELKQLAQVSAILAAAQAGLVVELPEPDAEPLEPIGLMGLWSETT